LLSLGPWNHVLFAFAGGYIGYNYSKWEKELLDKLNAERTSKGLPEIKRTDVLPWKN
jgi:hypothetical protein